MSGMDIGQHIERGFAILMPIALIIAIALNWKIVLVGATIALIFCSLLVSACVVCSVLYGMFDKYFNELR